AQVTDPNLVNPWGVSFSSTSPLWVSDNGTDVSTLYTGGVHGGQQNILSLVVSIPGGAPTGQVVNPTSDFVVSDDSGNSGTARFLFVGESGHLSGWAPNVPPPMSTQAQDAVVTPGAVYKGLALAQTADGPMLYAADFSAGTVDVYNGMFQRVITAGNFEDRRLPAGYGPFNVAVLDGKVYVAYAKQDADREDEVAGHGRGRVDVFSTDGTLLKRLSHHGDLNAPWGMTIAPAGFGKLSGDLLVGNFGDGRIHAFDAQSLAPRGALLDTHHRQIRIDGLWALTPGNGTEGGTDEVLFTAGPDDESHGLLGTLSLSVS
ncbi:MAG TPA: TIGR03118 family protein, partial [Nocardioidaceae bacterium]